MTDLVTWNMQGSKAKTEVIWQTGIANFFKNGVKILCLQECGAQPPSSNLHTAALAGNAQYNLYQWGTDRSAKYISFYHWDVNGNRCNLAIVSEQIPTAWAVLLPAVGPAWRPAIGAQIGGTWYFCLHAISPGGADAGALLILANAHAAGAPWFTAGDYNREPVPVLPTGNVCPPNTNTFSVENPQKKYDYMYSSAAGIVGIVQGLNLSDHFPVMYTVP